MQEYRIPEKQDYRTGNDKNNNVRRFLDVTTGHITLNDNNQLAEELPDHHHTPFLICRAYEYGYWIWVPDDEKEFAQLIENLKEAEYSEALVEIFEKARRLDCDYIVIDQSGPYHDDLEEFEW